MENSYQDLITDIQNKNPKINGKLEGGKRFKIKSDFKPAGDQPEAIKKLGMEQIKRHLIKFYLVSQVLGKHLLWLKSLRQLIDQL